MFCFSRPLYLLILNKSGSLDQVVRKGDTDQDQNSQSQGEFVEIQVHKVLDIINNNFGR